jgi:hypothetical protein
MPQARDEGAEMTKRDTDRWNGAITIRPSPTASSVGPTTTARRMGHPRNPSCPAAEVPMSAKTTAPAAIRLSTRSKVSVTEAPKDM